MEALRRRIFHFAIDYNQRGNFFSDLAAAEVERMVIMKFLMCHRHNYTHLLLREPLPVFLCLGASGRGVHRSQLGQAHRRRDDGRCRRGQRTKPIPAVQQGPWLLAGGIREAVRLNRAREMLEQPTKNASVIQIALKCGFQNPSHFARDYRLAFGELPSETLKRGRPPPRLRY